MADSEESAEEGAGAIVVIDPDPGSRNLAEDLEDDLECQLVAMDSMDFDMESSEEVLNASAFLVSWDLGIRAGADLVESIRGCEALAGKPILIATHAPTKEVVFWAMTLGADGVCTKPYDADEIAARLKKVGEEASEAA